MDNFKILIGAVSQDRNCEQHAFNIRHTGPSFNTGTENIQVSEFKRIGFEKKNGGFRWGRIGL